MAHELEEAEDAEGTEHREREGQRELCARKLLEHVEDDRPGHKRRQLPHAAGTPLYVNTHELKLYVRGGTW